MRNDGPGPQLGRHRHGPGNLARLRGTLAVRPGRDETRDRILNELVLLSDLMTAGTDPVQTRPASSPFVKGNPPGHATGRSGLAVTAPPGYKIPIGEPFRPRRGGPGPWSRGKRGACCF